MIFYTKQQKMLGIEWSDILFFDQNGFMVCVPHDPKNTDYQRYLNWVAEGNTAEEWDPQG